MTGWTKYTEARIDQFCGTTAEGRLNCVTIDLLGIDPRDADGFAPGICLDYADKPETSGINWSASVSADGDHAELTGRGTPARSAMA